MMFLFDRRSKFQIVTRNSILLFFKKNLENPIKIVYIVRTTLVSKSIQVDAC